MHFGLQSNVNTSGHSLLIPVPQIASKRNLTEDKSLGPYNAEFERSIFDLDKAFDTANHDILPDK